MRNIWKLKFLDGQITLDTTDGDWKSRAIFQSEKQLYS